MSVIVITGAAGVLGGAIATFLVDHGHHVVGIDLSEQRLDFPGTFIGGIDLTAAEGAAHAAQAAVAEGSISGLANIAGGFSWETVAEGTPESWEFLHRINVMTALHMSRALIPVLIQSNGAIVNVGANAASKAGIGMGAYAASKSGVSRLTEALAEELKGQVRVNAVLPSIIDTPANRKDMADADPSKWVKTEELAAVVAFLLSDAASAVTGALLPVVGRV